MQASRMSRSLLCRWTRPQEERRGIVPKLFPLLQRLSLLKSRDKYRCHRSRLSRPTRRRSFYVSNVAICWSSPAEASREPMRSEQGASAKSGCFGSRNSPPPSYGMNPRFQNHQNRVRSDLAVPAEKRSYVLSARITQESKTQGRRNLGATVSGYEFRRQKGRERHAHRTCPGISEG